jgi:hypothetical protein
MIYFIKNNQNQIKIGSTDNLKKRLGELQTGNSSKLIPLYIIENEIFQEKGSFFFEKHIHEICEKYRVGGEWYEASVLDFLLKVPWYKENMKKYIPTRTLVH